MKESLLALVQLPPPIHGAAIMNTRAISVLNTKYIVTTINLSTATSLHDTGKFSIKKFSSIAFLFKKIFLTLIKGKPKFAYYTLCPSGAAFYRDALIILLLKLFKISLIYHLHGQGLITNSVFKNIISKYIFKNSQVIHLSDVFWHEVKLFIPKKNFHVIPNCTTTNTLPKEQTGNKKTTFLYLSNFVRGKGPMLLLEAAENLYSRGLDCNIILAGEWYDLDLKNEISLWSSNNKHIIDSGFLSILGPVYGCAKDKLLSECDVVVFPSYIDTFPLILLEAQAFKRAIISTNTGAIPEILDYGNAGLIFEKNNSESLIQAMDSLLKNPEAIKKLKKASFIRYSNNYTEKLFSESLLRVFSTIIPPVY